MTDPLVPEPDRTGDATAPSPTPPGPATSPGPMTPPSTGPAPVPPITVNVAAPPRRGFWATIGYTAGATLTVLLLLGAATIVPIALLAGLVAASGPVEGSEPLDTVYASGDVDAEDRLLVIPIRGVIVGHPDELGFLSGVAGYEVKEQLRKAAEDESIDGVLLELDTPGGTIYGAHAISDGVAEYRRRTGNPVVAYVAGMSASGGMWAMAGADRIVADHGTAVGSIGVIIGPFERYDGVIGYSAGLITGGVQTTRGITSEYFTAGRGKDAGNPFRALTQEERRVINDGLQRAYREFVQHVSTNRKIPADTIVKTLGAHLYDSGAAREHGLVDEVGTREQALSALGDRAGLKADAYRVDRLETPGSALGALLGARRPGTDEGAAGNQAGAAGAAAPGTGSVLCGRRLVLAYAQDPRAVCGAR